MSELRTITTSLGYEGAQWVCTGCAVLHAELEALRHVAAVGADQEEKP